MKLTYKSSFILLDLLAPPIHPNGTPTIKLFRKFTLGKTNIGGTTTPDAPTENKTATSSLRSALVTDPIRFFPMGATTSPIVAQLCNPFRLSCKYRAFQICSDHTNRLIDQTEFANSVTIERCCTCKRCCFRLLHR